MMRGQVLVDGIGRATTIFGWNPSKDVLLATLNRLGSYNGLGSLIAESNIQQIDVPRASAWVPEVRYKPTLGEGQRTIFPEFTIKKQLIS